MAMSKPEKDLFVCPICSETFKSPKILTCLHTFCEECIHEYIVSLGRNTMDKLSEFPCPICKITTKPENPEVEISKLASTLHTNFSMSTMIAQAHGNDTKTCDVCHEHQQTTIAQFWCKACTHAFCEECNSKHSWFMKKHVVCPLKDAQPRVNGIDLDVISEKCIKHPTDVVQMFCFDHKCTCCINCAFLEHRGCKNVQTITDVIESDKVKDKLQNLNNMKDEIVKLLKSKRSECIEFEAKATKTEEDAAKFIKSLKFKLDELFETFTKQLHVVRDDRLSDMDAHVRMLNQVIQNLEHWINSAGIVKETGSKTQFFIYLDKIDNQLNSSNDDLVQMIRNDSGVELEVTKDSTLTQIQTLGQLGTILKIENRKTDEMGQMLKLCKSLDLKMSPTFETLKVQKSDTIPFLKSKIRCGVCIDDQHMLLGNCIDSKTSTLRLVNKNGVSISSAEFKGEIKRLCYVSEKKQLYISCYYGNIFRAIVEGETIHEVIKIKKDNTDFGDIVNYRDHIYIVTDGAIKTFPVEADLDKSLHMTECFKANTSSSGLNGLYIEEEYITFTSQEDEVKRVTFDGKHIFCFKNASLKSIRDLTVLPSGLILVINSSQIHVLSSDDQQHRILLDTFEKITSAWDMWLDTDGETLYIAGHCAYVDVYRLTSD